VGAGLVKELQARGHFVASCGISQRPDEVGFSMRTDVTQPTYARCDVGEFRQIERVIEKLGSSITSITPPLSLAVGTARICTSPSGTLTRTISSPLSAGLPALAGTSSSCWTGAGQTRPCCCPRIFSGCICGAVSGTGSWGGSATKRECSCDAGIAPSHSARSGLPRRFTARSRRNTRSN